MPGLTIAGKEHELNLQKCVHVWLKTKESHSYADRGLGTQCMGSVFQKPRVGYRAMQKEIPFSVCLALNLPLNWSFSVASHISPSPSTCTTWLFQFISPIQTPRISVLSSFPLHPLSPKTVSPGSSGQPEKWYIMERRGQRGMWAQVCVLFEGNSAIMPFSIIVHMQSLK